MIWRPCALRALARVETAIVADGRSWAMFGEGTNSAGMLGGLGGGHFPGTLSGFRMLIRRSLAATEHPEAG